MSTEIPGTLKRLRLGDQMRVKVGVVNKEGVGRGTKGNAVAVVKDGAGNEVARSGEFEVLAGIPVYTDEWSSLALHEVGIFGPARMVFRVLLTRMISDLAGTEVDGRQQVWYFCSLGESELHV